MNNLRQFKICAVLGLSAFSLHATIPLDNFDLQTGPDPVGGISASWVLGENSLLETPTASATYTESSFWGTVGDEQMEVNNPSGGYVFTAFRYRGNTFEEGPRNDPFFNLLQTHPLFLLDYENPGTEGFNIDISINTADGFTYNNLPGASIFVPAGARGTYSFNLGENDTLQNLLTQWTEGAFQLRILQATASGTPSIARYDNFRLQESSDPRILENYDDALAFFTQFNSANMEYLMEDSNGDGDNELVIAVKESSSSPLFQMGLRRKLTSSDSFVELWQDNPILVFDYANLTGENISIGVVVQSNMLDYWPNFGLKTVLAGESGTYHFDMSADPLFSSLLQRFINGEGDFTLRIVQAIGEDALARTRVAYDNFRLSTAAEEAPTNWAGFEVLAGNNVNTADLMGWLQIIPFNSWVWSYGLTTWLYLPENTVSPETGFWFYAYRSPAPVDNPAGENSWAGFPLNENNQTNTGNYIGWVQVYPGTGYIYSYAIQSFLYAPEEAVASPAGAYLYLIP